MGYRKEGCGVAPGAGEVRHSERREIEKDPRKVQQKEGSGGKKEEERQGKAREVDVGAGGSGLSGSLCQG